MNRERHPFSHGFERLVAQRPDAPAIVDGRTERTFSYAQLDSLITRAETFLAGHGATAGKTIVSLLPNGIEALVVFLAAARAGLNLAPLSILSTPREVLQWATLTRPDLILAPAPLPPPLDDALASVSRPVVRLAPGDSERFPQPSVSPAREHDGGRLYLQTSGTTSSPKVMVHEIDRLWLAARAWTQAHSTIVDRRSRFLNCLPVAYLGGLFNLCLIPLAAGGSLVITESFSGSSVLTFWSDIERFEINTIWLVPTILRSLLSIHERTLGKHERAYRNIKAAFIGTAPLSRETKERGELAFGVRLLENFALSETTFITSEFQDDPSNKQRGAGRVLPYVDVRLRTLANNEGLPLGTGELIVRSPFLFLGYLNADNTIDQARDSEGYFATADLARFAADGETVIPVGRTRDIVKKGGYLISLAEIETAAMQHPSVAEASAVGVSHEFFGEDIALHVRFRDGSSDDPVGTLRIWLSETLAKFKWPARIVSVTTLPQTSSGKVQKYKLIASD